MNYKHNYYKYCFKYQNICVLFEFKLQETVYIFLFELYGNHKYVFINWFFKIFLLTSRNKDVNIIYLTFWFKHKLVDFNMPLISKFNLNCSKESIGFIGTI